MTTSITAKDKRYDEMFQVENETKTFGMSEDLKKRRSYLKQTTLSWVERLLPWVEDTFMSPILPLLPTLLPIIFSILQDSDKE